MKHEFINKWKSWWMLQKQGAELTDAFERELNAIIEQEVASKNLVQPDVSGRENRCIGCGKVVEKYTIACFDCARKIM